MASMKLKFTIFAGLVAAAALVAGCVNTVTGGRTAGVPFIRDTIEARYDKPADPVFQAARAVIAENGTLMNEGTLYGQTNSLGNVARTIKGKVNERTVYVRVEALDPKITATAVQTRTSAGVSDIDLAAQIDKQIALKLAR
jgi:hypothetical protein